VNRLDSPGGYARDAEARRRAQQQFDRPLVLEAGAGTGKTSTLVARLLHWSLGPGWERARDALNGESREAGPAPEAIARHVLQRQLAITFTEAAAAQMASRVALALIGLSRDVEPRSPDEAVALAGFQVELLGLEADALRRRATALLGSLDHLAAQTFHSWCRGLLAQYPFEAGIHPAFVIDADGAMTERLADEVLEGLLAELYADDPAAPAVRLLTESVGANILREQLISLAAAGVPAADLERDRFTPAALEPLFEQLEASTGTMLEMLQLAASWDQATKVVRESAAMVGGVKSWCAASRQQVHDADAMEAALDELRGIVPDSRLKGLGKWSRSQFGSQWEEAHLPELGDQFGAASGRLHELLVNLLAVRPRRFVLLSRTLLPALRQIQEEKRVRGILSFDDLLDHAVVLLDGNAAIQAAERSSCEQLMVDEFQDTDRRQCELVRLLALSGRADSRPGLFIVGDPKQSLYGWREADLAAYDEFLHEIETAGGEILSLSVNFRSVPAVLREVERVVAPIMERVEGLQPAFEPLLPSPQLEDREGFSDPAHRPIEYWVTWQGQGGDGEDATPTSAANAAEVEFAALAHDLRRLRDSGVAWRTIGLLMRSRSRLTELLDSLRAAGIPYQVEGERTYYLRREVIEAAALLRAIAQPRDRLALVSVLRSAWVGVPDAALLPLLERRFDELLSLVAAPGDPAVSELAAIARQVAASLPTDLPGLAELHGWELNLIAAVRAIALLRQTLKESPVGTFVEQLRRLSLVDATEAARSLGAFRTANLDRFFEQLEQILETEPDLHGLLRFLRRSVQDSRQAPAAPLASAADDAVQVMTIHAAKGLDFDHVYLLQTAAGGRGRTLGEFAARRPSVGELGWGLVLHGAPGPGWPLRAMAERRREAAERVRLLYVAITRSRSRLVVSGNWPRSPRGRPPEAAHHLQDLLERRLDLPPDLGELARRPEAGNGVEAGGAYWRFPDAHSAEPPTVPDQMASWIPADDELEALFGEQAEVRRAAEARQSKPLLVRASGAGFAPDLDGRVEAILAPDESTEVIDDAAAGSAHAARLGTLVHHGLENWRAEEDSAAERARILAAIEASLEGDLSGDEAAGLVARARHLLAAFDEEEGPMGRRWRELLPSLAARELPVLLSSHDADGVQTILTGAIDLVYRDPDSDAVVLVDFKTDRLASLDAAIRRAERYRSQADAYRRAIQTALQLETPPAIELWFLDLRAIVRLEDDGPPFAAASQHGG